MYKSVIQRHFILRWSEAKMLKQQDKVFSFINSVIGSCCAKVFNNFIRKQVESLVIWEAICSSIVLVIDSGK